MTSWQMDEMPARYCKSAGYLLGSIVIQTIAGGNRLYQFYMTRRRGVCGPACNPQLSVCAASFYPSERCFISVPMTAADLDAEIKLSYN